MAEESKVDEWAKASIPVLIDNGKYKEMIKALEEKGYLKSEESSIFGIFIVLLSVFGLLFFLGFVGYEIHNGKFQSIFYDNSTYQNSNQCPICPEIPSIPVCPSCPTCPVPQVNVTISPNLNININSST